MAKYITKEAAIEAFEWGDADVIEDYGDGCDFGFSRGAIKSGINSIPAADVAPVVRCKDCKYSCKDGTGRTCEGYWYELSEFAVPVEDDGFCSYGERKDGGADHG